MWSWSGEESKYIGERSVTNGFNTTNYAMGNIMEAGDGASMEAVSNHEHPSVDKWHSWKESRFLPHRISIS